MPTLQFIHHGGRLVAVVIADTHAVVSEGVREEDRAMVHAMCVYAMEIAAGDRAGPYCDDDARRHATNVRARRRA